uniref:SCD domain-containing protein n=1 Tax=Panagrellus redivivus TaxID=6233 RepID=A0A7E4VDZ8_PANRE
MSDDDTMSVATSAFDASNASDATFKDPNISQRGRKRKPVIHDDGSDYFSSPKRPARGRGTGRARGAARTPRADRRLPQIDDSSLFNVVKSGKSFEQVINRWIDAYDRHPDAGIAQIFQLLVHACGCRGVITVQMLQAPGFQNKDEDNISDAVRELIRRLADEFDEECAEYPIIQTGPQWRKFRTNFENFLKLLIGKCRAGIVFDNKLMDRLIEFLLGLAESNVRAFRHTATFAAMKVSTALVDLVVQLIELRNKNNLQIETEQAKLQQHATSEQLDVLLATKAEIDEKISDCILMTGCIFKGVFVHRYRDVVPDIRSICITELGAWMTVHASYFLEDTYLKYAGWLLYDKQPEVRLKCITALLPLFEETEYAARLELFINKFKDRLVSMITDTCNEVAIKVCQLMNLVFRQFPTMLEVSDCVPIYEAVYSSNRALAVAAGEFLNTKVFPGAQEAGDFHNKTMLSDLILFYVEGDVHKHAAFLVDALIDTAPMIKDWATMTDMLLSDECDEYDSHLVEIMTIAIRQASTGDVPVSRGTKRGASTKDAKLLVEERTRMSEILIPTLPKLLSRHIADRDKIANLTSIPQYFVLELYPNARMMKYLTELVAVLERIVDQHSDDEILANVATAFNYFRSNLAVQQATDTARNQLLDELAVALRTSLTEFQNENQIDDEDEAQLLSRFRKMNAFAAAEDLRRTDLWDLILNLLNNSDKVANPQICEKAILNLFHTVNWDIRRLSEAQEKNVGDAVKKLKKRRDQLLNAIKAILSASATGVENAFLCLCDLLILLNHKLADDFPTGPASTLEIALNRDFNNTINTFVVDNVFVAEESDTIRTLDPYAQIEMMAKRRNLLSQFCKLIINGVLPITDSALVLRYYVKFYSDFGDILKALLVKCRELDRCTCAKAVSMALISAFEEMKSASPNGLVDPVEEDFIQLRDLAKRFAMSFGPDALRNRYAIATIHQHGILHALEINQAANRRRAAANGKPTNVAFLEVLLEFSPRLVRQDKLVVYRYLEKHCPVTAEQLASDDIWQPYLLYRASLQEKEKQVHDDLASVRGGARGRGRGRRRANSTTPSEVSAV